MKLDVLLQPWMSDIADQDIQHVTIRGLAHDSRHVQPGDLFFACPGLTSDARMHLVSVAQAGASAIVYESQQCPKEMVLPPDIPCVGLSGLSVLRGPIAARFYEYPTQDLSIIGVTGTNGKTTIAYLLAQAQDRLGVSTVYLGTLGQGHVDALQPGSHTTPDPLNLQRFLFESKQADVQSVCMEVSSHALHQERVAGVDFKQAIYTNLTHDHLDYHKTIDAYGDAKARLFSMPSLAWAIINADDAHAAKMKASVRPNCRILTYGLSPTCDVFADQIQMNLTGSRFHAHTPWGTFELAMKLIGQFNVYNSLAVLSSLLASGYTPSDVINVMQQLHASKGRMEIVATKPSVLVDYAHTPDALENALTTVASLSPRRLIVVFGCGGDRDKTKRSIMGEIASRYADHIILTSDNPRTEDPMQIIADIQQGIAPTSSYDIYSDRAEAIRQALENAREDDLVLIAGKGHEDYQQIGLERFPFSDQTIVRDFFS